MQLVPAHAALIRAIFNKLSNLHGQPFMSLMAVLVLPSGDGVGRCLLALHCGITLVIFSKERWTSNQWIQYLMAIG